MNNNILIKKTLDDYESLIKKQDGYYYPINPVYSNIELKKQGNQYIVINFNDYIKTKTRYKPKIIIEKYIDNQFILEYIEYLILE